MPDERVMAFIDGNNLYHALKDRFGRASIDFSKLCEKLVAGRRLVRAYYYNAPLDQTRDRQRYQEQQRFFRSIQRLPYIELRLGRLVYRGGPTEAPYEKGVDVLLTTDMLVHAFRGNYETAILVSGDTDYAAALQAVKDQGKHVEVALFGDPWSSQLLRNVADKTLEIDSDFLKACWR